MNRIQKLQERLLQENVDAFLITAPVDLFYFTGFSLSAGNLLVTKEGATLLVDGRYFETIKGRGEIPIFLANDELFKSILAPFKKIGVDAETTTLQALYALEKQRFPIHGIPCLCKEIRAVKDPQEIALLKQSAKLAAEGFDFVRSLLKEGVLESDLAFELEWFWRKKSASGVSFEPIIAFGPHSAMPHYRAGKGVLKRGDIVLVDIGVCLNQYQSDMTRVVFFGDVSKELEKIRSIVEEAAAAAKACLKPGIEAQAVDFAAREHIGKSGYKEQFSHSLGHGVGLEIHENPTLRQNSPKNVLLKAGMVITIEPGIYLPGVGGVRLEDTVLITEAGYENLTERPYLFYA